MNDEKQHEQHQQSERRINERLETGEYADAVNDQRISKLEELARKISEAFRKFTIVP